MWNERLFSSLTEGLEEIDASGKWISYLVKNRDVYSLEIQGRLDIGGLESYLEAQRYLEKLGDSR